MTEKAAPEACPACGGTSGFEAVASVSGPWVTHHAWNGDTFDTFMDKLRWRAMRKTVKCLDCGKKIPNPMT